MKVNSSTTKRGPGRPKATAAKTVTANVKSTKRSYKKRAGAPTVVSQVNKMIKLKSELNKPANKKIIAMQNEFNSIASDKRVKNLIKDLTAVI